MYILSFLLSHAVMILSVIFVIALLLYIIIRYPIFSLSPKCFQAQHMEQASTPVPLEAQHENTLPPVSIVIVAHDQGVMLEQNLPLFATQAYENYEIIVVDEASTDDTLGVLGRIESQYHCVRHTFTPTNTRYLSRSKLAVTLGVRAAKNEWILLTQGDCRPDSPHWISDMAQTFSDRYDIVLGLSHMERANGLLYRRWSLDSLIHQLRFFRSACGGSARGKAVGGSEANVSFRKSLFMKHGGFSRHLNLLGGDGVLFIDEAAERSRTAVVISPSSAIVRSIPSSSRVWENEKLYLTAAGCRLSSAGKLERFCWAMASWAYWTAIACSIVLLSIASPLAVGIAAIVLFVVATVGGLCLFRRSALMIGETPSLLLLVIYQFTQPFYSLSYRIRCRRHRRDMVRGL